MKRTILLLTLGVVLFSCQTKKSVLSGNYIQGTSYSGILPCQDCNGISQVVVLDSGNTFRLSETYLGKEVKCKEKCGKWAVEDGKLVLFSDTATIAQYAVSGGNLVYLNEANMAYRGHGGQGMLSRKKLLRSKKINEKFLEGLDVVAFGTDATWSLDITHNKAIQFSVPGMEAPVAFSPVVPKLSGDSLVYTVVTAEDKMQIVFTPGYCGDNTSENIYDYKVTISFRGKTYSGCGAILNADGGLDGIWELQSFEGHNNWSERPFIAIDLNSEKFYGNTGCNSFSGTTRLRQLKVCFSDIHAATKKECAGYDESALIEALVKCNGFSINGETLELTQNGSTVMTFLRKTSGNDQL